MTDKTRYQILVFLRKHTDLQRLSKELFLQEHLFNKQNRDVLVNERIQKTIIHQLKGK